MDSKVKNTKIKIVVTAY